MKGSGGRGGPKNNCTESINHKEERERESGRVFHQSMISNGFYPKMTFTFWMTAFSRG